MIENIQNIMEHYDLKLLNTHRGRGAVICETDKGIKLLKELEMSPSKVQFEYHVKEHLIKNGYERVDQYLNTKEDGIFCELDERTYTLKDWHLGKECDFKDYHEILSGVKNLAHLHCSLREVELPEQTTTYSSLGEIKGDYIKHNTEIKKVRNFIRDKRSWTDFEIVFLQNYQYFYDIASDATAQIDDLQYCRLIEEATANRELCHGNYNQHNIIMNNNNIATVNFDKCSFNVQIADLYHLMRKVMEKNKWSVKLGMDMIETYAKIIPMDKCRLKYLYIMLLYPEKFWKIINHYYNTKKSWLSKRSLEKLKTVIEQKENKEIFLKALERV